MAMYTCPLSDVGFYIDAVVAAYIMLAADQAAGTVPKEIAALVESGKFDTEAKACSLPWEYHNLSDARDQIEDSTNFIGCFTGEVSTLLPERADSPFTMTLDENNELLYIPAAKSADLFKAAYANPEELLEECKSALAGKGVKLPEDFDWWAHIVSINGTTFC